MFREATHLRDLFERHVLYEILMLVGTRECIHAGEAETIKYNALVESFCIHARLLIDFFDNGKLGSAGTFAEPAYVAFEDGRLADSLLKKISTQVGHFSLKRTVDPSKMIDHETLEQIFLCLAAEIANFRRQLKPEFRSLWPASLEVPVAPVMANAAQGMTLATRSAHASAMVSD